MKIELTISTCTLGDVNTNNDNKRYATVVKRELKSQYPDADVSVELISNITAGSCWVSEDDTGEIAENVDQIANKVWSKANY